MTAAEELWQSMLTKLETSISAVNFDVWIKTLDAVQIVDSRLVLCASNGNIRNFVNDKFKISLVEAMASINAAMTDILIIEPTERGAYCASEEHYVAQEAVDSSPKMNAVPINPKYNFENFVVGKSNQFMYAAARAVAEEPGIRYNPLFIYGGSGLGKTHIMHAIGNAVRVTHVQKKILYVSSEKFLNEFIESVRKGKGKDFRDKYRDIDILMIDDIQFIAGKPGVQEELFHTFNALHGMDKQIIFTSDRPPKEIRDLEERLQSRFEGGLMVDVQLPDVETRTAILQKKALALKFKIEGSVLAFMAEEISSNIRDLEGLLNRVIFLSRLGENTPSIDMVKEALKDSNEKSEESVSADRVIECVCRYYNISKEDLTGKKKTREIAEPRQICMYLVNEIVGLPLARVGESFGGRDHTTVMHARNKVLGLLQSNVKVKLAVNDIKDMVFKV